MSMRRPSNASSSVSAPPSPMSGVAASTSTIGSRRRAAAMASPSCVCAFSRIRKASSSAWKVLRSTILGAPSPSLMMSFIVLLCEPWSGFRLSRALSGGFFGVGYDVNPLRVSRGLGVVVVVPVPPLVRLGLGIALWRVLPSFLAAERCDIEVAPDAAHGLVGSVVDEVGAKHLLAVADEYIVAMPLVHAEVGVEAVRDGVPRHLPAHSRLHALNVLLRRARGVRECGVAGVQMGQVTDLIGAQGAAAASMVGPAEHAGLKEGAIEDQLSAALEQIEQAYLALGPIEFVLLLDGHPWHSPAFGGQSVAGASEGPLLHEELLARSLPSLRRHDWRRVRRELPFPVFLVSLFARCHFIFSFAFKSKKDETGRDRSTKSPLVLECSSYSAVAAPAALGGRKAAF